MNSASAQSIRDVFGPATVLRAIDIVKRGVPRWRLREAELSGELNRVSRGMYSLPGTDLSEKHSFVMVARTAPHAAICLLSALRFHELTTQNPHEVWIAIAPKARKPVIAYPPIRVVRFSPERFSIGLEEHLVEGTPVRVYSVARTVVDLFGYRNKIGIDVAMEALKEGWRERRFSLSELNSIASQCRMEKVMRPYVESLVS